MSKIALVAALEREVAPLVRSWKTRNAAHGGRVFKFFEDGNVSVVCGGIGSEAGRRAAEAIIQDVRPFRIVSVGFAGALDPRMSIGEVFEPRIVVDAKDGSRTDTGGGEGTLVSFDSVVCREQKKKLAKAYAARAVDMEAAAVAQAAQLRGIEFAAIKVVSDEFGSNMPEMERFIAPDGGFRSGEFSLHVAVRPWLWGSTMALLRNTGRASRALCAALERSLSRDAVTEISGGEKS